MIVVISSFYSALKSSKKVQNNSWNHFSPKKTAKTTIWRNVVQKYWIKCHILKMLFFELGATKLYFFVSWGTLLCLSFECAFCCFCYYNNQHTVVQNPPKKMFSSFYKIIIFSVNLFIFFWILSQVIVQEISISRKFSYFDTMCVFLCMWCSLSTKL